MLYPIENKYQLYHSKKNPPEDVRNKTKNHIVREWEITIELHAPKLQLSMLIFDILARAFECGGVLTGTEGQSATIRDHQPN